MIREYKETDVVQMMDIWNQVVGDGQSFPQLEPLTLEEAQRFFKEQTYTGVAENDGEIVGLYILHPNNIGRCGHISNASYAVKSNTRGLGIGRQLVEDSLEAAKTQGFRIMQFNAVLSINESAIHLYKKLGFIPLGTIPDGFFLPNGEYTDIIPFYKELTK